MDVAKEILQIKEGYESKYGFSDPENYSFRAKKGLTEEIVKQISAMKNEPEWMLDFRLKALKIFFARPMPPWGADLSGIDFSDIYYYIKPMEKQGKTWDEVPDRIKQTFDKLGIPEAERKFLSGVGAQYESESIYHKIEKELEQQGVVFMDMDSGLREYPEIVKKHFGKIIPPGDNKFAALNSAVWSGGSFVFVPEGVKVTMPLQAYFRINAKNMGQFERTLIIAEPNASVHYVEGCFTKGTPIVTEKGTTPIEDVKKGEKVLTHTGEYKNVYYTQVRPYTGKMYEITYYGDNTHPVNATEEHPFLAVKRQKIEYKNTEWQPEWIGASQLEKSDYLAVPIDRSVEEKDVRTFPVKAGNGMHGFKDKTLTLKTDSDFFRLIGYYLAEGSISSGHYLNFTFNVNERRYIDDVKELLERYFGKAALEYKPYKNGISVVLCSIAAVRFFESQFSKGAKNKKMPIWVLKESTKKQKELVKAFWRGDGNFMMVQYPYGVKRMFRMNTISETLASQLRDIVLRLDIFASLNVNRRTGKRNHMYCIYVGGSFLQKFAEIVDAYPATEVVVGNQIAFQKLKTVNAKSFAHITENYAFVPIKSIKTYDVDNLPVYNFSVQDDESYVAGGVAVHNCSAPSYSENSLHSAVVELLAKEGSKIKYTTIQNWSSNVYNLVTKRGHAHRNATITWLDGNIGSKVTMKYPSVFLLGEGARAEVVSIAYAGKGQVQDAGGKAVHLASNTSSTILAKSLSKDGGKTTYRGLLKVAKGAKNIKSNVRCDALILDNKSASDTIPYMDVAEKNVSITHEATVGKINEEQLFYLMSRGMTESEAMALVVRGFIEPFVKELPMEYAVELNKLIELEMTGAVG